jgi:sulfite reductase (NADPH) hemoprotein beta-component
VPQYFVMVGGGAHDGGASFGRLAAKIPARRIPQAVERLIDLYATERRPGETATQFFGRVELDVVKGRLAELETLRPGDAVLADFIDLAEATEFAPEVLDGECSA